jgi:exopolyphosphatase/guanosine-5'-triphosphate,3'-diphosphate pyrophosphatase
VGTGGTATILARMALHLDSFHRDRIDGAVLSRKQVLEWMVQLWSMSLERRRQIVGLPSGRADIILTGVAIYEAVMGYFDFDELCISTRGLRFGALMERP